MKSTDMARRDRELKKSQKKQEVLQKKMEKRDDKSIGTYINNLHSLFYFDVNKIYNLDSQEIKDFIDDLKLSLPEKQWENIIRKAVKKTKVTAREEAINTLKVLLSD